MRQHGAARRFLESPSRGRRSATARLALLLLAAALLGAAAGVGIARWGLPARAREFGPGWTALLLAALLAAAAWWAAAWTLAPWRRLHAAVESALLRYRDGDFSTSMTVQGRGEIAELGHLHNALGAGLRAQRQQLAQRELLLDTVVQHTPIAMVLANAAGRVAYANVAARRLLHDGRKLEGTLVADVLARQPEPLRAAVEAAQDSLFAVPGRPPSEGEEQFHLAVRTLQLQGRPHRLYLLRRMTRELARQEVASWKRVIRVLSHELNNSLAPISSMAHSGAELARRGAAERLPGIFASIAERAGHLHGFVAGYAEFARLPAPRRTVVDWDDFLASLRAHSAFRLLGSVPDAAARFDAPQVAQAVTNLLRNAHESGSTADAVTLSLRRSGDRLRIEVADAGTGMSAAVRAQAVLPFYSTKRSGTGLGLALAREIAEAHGGRLLLADRAGGGTVAAIDLEHC